MHLIELMAMRMIPGAGVYFSLTRRCPLSCAHCSTNSSITSAEHDGGIFLRFAHSMSVDAHPEVVLLTGGEPFLRPRLIEQIANHGHEVGFRTQALCGMFFARNRGRIPPAIERAIRSIDHFSASLDVFHEREVGRIDVFNALERILDWGKAVSLQVTGHGSDDPYLVELIADIRQHFRDEVPILATQVAALGRAKEWLEDRPPGQAEAPDAPIAPCALAGWPVVAFDGTVVTCCNQDVVDGVDAPHLVLGNAARDTWPAVVDRLGNSAVLRAIRLFGPLYVQQQIVGEKRCGGYCQSCTSLRRSDAPKIVAHMRKTSVIAIEKQFAGLRESVDPVRLMGNFGIREFAPLLKLGYERAPLCAA